MPGKVIIQTYNPDHYSIKYAKEQNYNSFYKSEIALRKQLKYPPFCDIILISIAGNEEKMVEKVANFFYTKIQKSNLENISIYKPVPAPINKIKNKYRWRIIMKGKLDNNIIDILNHITEDFYKKNVKNVQVVIDTNPNNMM